MEEKPKKPLEQWMLELGYTQRSLAREAGVSHSIISLLLDGTRPNLRSDTQKKIATALGLEIRQIKEFEETIRARLEQGNLGATAAA